MVNQCTKFEVFNLISSRDILEGLKICKSWLTPTDHTMWCITPSSHRAVHKDGCCDWRVIVVGWLLTTPGNDWHAVTKLFLVQRLMKTSRVNYAYVWRYSNFVFPWQIFSGFRGLCPLDQKL